MLQCLHFKKKQQVHYYTYIFVLFYNPIGQVLISLEHNFYKQYSTLEHDFYKLPKIVV